MIYWQKDRHRDKQNEWLCVAETIRAVDIFLFKKKIYLLFSNKLLHTNWETERASISIIIQKREFCLQNKKIIKIVSLLKYGIVGVSYWNHGAIITNRNNMKENSFIKVYWILHGLEVERDSLWTKNRVTSYYQTTNLLKTWFSFLVCKKGQKTKG